MGLFSEFKGGYREGYGSGEKFFGALGAFGAVLAGIVVLPILLVVWVVELFEDPQKKELVKTRALFEEVKALWDASPLEGDGHVQVVTGILREAFKRSGDIPSDTITEKLIQLVSALLIDEELWELPEVDWSQKSKIGLHEGVSLRNTLRRQKRFLSEYDYHMQIWQECVVRVVFDITASLPQTAFLDEEDEQHAALEVAIMDLLDDPREIVEDVAFSFFNAKIKDANLFVEVRDHLQNNLLRASGIALGSEKRSNKKLVYPTDATGLSPDELVDTYLGGTGFDTFFGATLPFSIPVKARFEHAHIVGGTGHGKTQFLQHLIHNDLLQVRDGNASVVVIDSQGDLIDIISHLSYFSPTAEKSLSDRLMLIDPNDIEHPVALNMFDVNRERLEGYSLIDREKILNGTIELYEYIFGALLGAELTQKQGVIFRYLARLMLAIPNATVQTLRELMEDGKPFKPYMQGLQGTSRKFFETQFFHPSFNTTKSQILRRLWGVLSNTTFERMFSNPHNKVDLFDAMNSGKVILINTAQDLLKQEGCQIFGRFFIAMIAQAAMERATIPREKRKNTFVYIDEAAQYFDANDTYIEQLLNQARKYSIGLHLAHQNLGQLGQSLKSSIMASTSIKIAGGVSAGDAKSFAQEMRCDADFIQGVRKYDTRTEFACWVKHVTPQAIRITVPLGSVEKLPVISDADYQALITKNRSRYCTTLEEVERFIEAEPPAAPVDPVIAEPPPEPIAVEQTQAETPKPMEPEAPKETLQERVQKTAHKREKLFAEEPAELGQGGKEHTYIQNLVKQFAEDRNFRAVIEQDILDGTGRVDVALKRDELSIACEISITTTGEHELGNVEKCLIAGFEEVLVISPDPKHLKRIKGYVQKHLESAYRDRVRFLDTEGVIAYLDELEAASASREETVRGYKVKVTHKRVDPAEREERRKEISRVISGSLKRIQDKKPSEN